MGIKIFYVKYSTGSYQFFFHDKYAWILIWKENHEENLVALCFLCNGNTKIVQEIIDAYRQDQKQYFFNDIVRKIGLRIKMNDS